MPTSRLGWVVRPYVASRNVAWQEQPASPDRSLSCAGDFADPALNVELRRFLLRDFLGPAIVGVTVVWTAASIPLSVFAQHPRDGGLLLGLLAAQCVVSIAMLAMVLFAYFRLRPSNPLSSKLLMIAATIFSIAYAIRMAFEPIVRVSSCGGYDFAIVNGSVTDAASVAHRQKHCVDTISPWPTTMLYSVFCLVRLYPQHGIPIAAMLLIVYGGSYALRPPSSPENPYDAKTSSIVTDIAVQCAVGLATVVFCIRYHGTSRERFIAAANAERARHLSMAEMREVDGLLQRALPRPVLHRMVAAGVEIRDHTDAAAVGIADIAGFSAWVRRRGARDGVFALHALVTAADQLLSDGAGVEKIKTAGDSYCVASGLPEAFTCYASAACRFGRALMDAAAQLANADDDELFHSNDRGDVGQRSGSFVDLARYTAHARAPRASHVEGWRTGALRLRFGVHCGKAFGSVLGTQRLSYEVYGDAYDGAVDAVSAAPPGQVCITSAARLRLAQEAEMTEGDAPTVAKLHGTTSFSPVCAEAGVEASNTNANVPVARTPPPAAAEPGHRQGGEDDATMAKSTELLLERSTTALFDTKDDVEAATEPLDLTDSPRMRSKQTPAAAVSSLPSPDLFILSYMPRHALSDRLATAVSSDHQTTVCTQSVASGYHSPGNRVGNWAADRMVQRRAELERKLAFVLSRAPPPMPNAPTTQPSRRSSSIIAASLPARTAATTTPPMHHQLPPAHGDARLMAMMASPVLRSASDRPADESRRSVGLTTSQRSPASVATTADQRRSDVFNATGRRRPSNPMAIASHVPQISPTLLAEERRIGKTGTASIADMDATQLLATMEDSVNGPFREQACLPLLFSFADAVEERGYVTWVRDLTHELRRDMRLAAVVLYAVLFGSFTFWGGVSDHDRAPRSMYAAATLYGVALVIALVNAGLMVLRRLASADPILSQASVWTVIVAGHIARSDDRTHIVSNDVWWLFPLHTLLVDSNALTLSLLTRTLLSTLVIVAATLPPALERQGDFMFYLLISATGFVTLPPLRYLLESLLRRAYVETRITDALAAQQHAARSAREVMLQGLVPPHVMGPLRAWLQSPSRLARPLVQRHRAVVVCHVELLGFVPGIVANDAPPPLTPATLKRAANNNNNNNNTAPTTATSPAPAAPPAELSLLDAHRAIDALLEQCSHLIKVRMAEHRVLLAGPLNVKARRDTASTNYSGGGIDDDDDDDGSDDDDGDEDDDARRHRNVTAALADALFIVSAAGQIGIIVDAGIDVGPVAGSIVGSTRLSYDLHGEAVDTAERVARAVATGRGRRRVGFKEPYVTGQARLRAAITERAHEFARLATDNAVVSPVALQRRSRRRSGDSAATDTDDTTCPECITLDRVAKPPMFPPSPATGPTAMSDASSSLPPSMRSGIAFEAAVAEGGSRLRVSCAANPLVIDDGDDDSDDVAAAFSNAAGATRRAPIRALRMIEIAAHSMELCGMAEAVDLAL